MLCLLLLMAKPEAYLTQWCSKKKDRTVHKHLHKHAVAFKNSEMGVTVIPESILCPPPSWSYFCPLSVRLWVGKVQKVRASIQEYGSISTGFSISLPSETGRGNLGSQRNTVHIFKISQTEKAAIDTSYEIFPCNVMSSLKGIVFFLWKSPTGSVFIN